MTSSQAISDAVEHRRFEAITLEHRAVRQRAYSVCNLIPFGRSPGQLRDREARKYDLERRDRLRELAHVALEIRRACRCTAHAISDFPFHPIRAHAAKPAALIGHPLGCL